MHAASPGNGQLLTPGCVQEKFRIHRETWGTFDDNKVSDLDVGAHQGDLRAAMAPFLANITFRELPVSLPLAAVFHLGLPGLFRT